MLISGPSLARLAAIAATATMVFVAAGASAQTLKEVKDRGVLNCGVSTGILGFSSADDKGAWSGIDVDVCRAVAAAIFNDDSKVKYIPLNAEERFKALQSGKIDVLSRNSTWTMSREAEYGVAFAAVNYYDGQGFMVRKSRGVESALSLDNSKVCVQSGTTTQLNLGDYFRANHMTYEEMSFPNAKAALKAYDSGTCDVFTSDVSQLYAERLKLSAPNDHVVLADVISKEPLGPAVKQGDSQWLEIVKWSYYAMLNAEELGVTSKTVDDALKSEKPDIRRLVGTEGSYGEQIGLTRDWAARIIRLVGNYAESYERNVGTGSKLGIPRGLNHLWSEGGIQYAPPIR
jgi:general L-amino acid transport system substrate-binding protein